MSYYLFLNKQVYKFLTYKERRKRGRGQWLKGGRQHRGKAILGREGRRATEGPDTQKGKGREAHGPVSEEPQKGTGANTVCLRAG